MSKRRKKPNRREKKQMTTEGLCWKCESELKQLKKKLYECTNCGLKIQPNGI